ncbi:helix-turn-helix transcriptional regulator [Natrialbaceae archaeon A-CW3]
MGLPNDPGDVIPIARPILEGDGTSATLTRWLVEPLGSDGTMHWLLASPVASVWDVVLVTVLSLLIGGLVGIRLAHVLSRFDLDISVPVSFSTGADDDTDDHQISTNHSFQHVVSASTPSKLLSDEGEVIRLLVENEGQIRQNQITTETGWSKSKVSRIVSQMHEDGMIDKMSAGRENVISLADQPTDDTPLNVEKPLP